MLRLPTVSTPTSPPFPYTTLVRSEVQPQRREDSVALHMSVVQKRVQVWKQFVAGLEYFAGSLSHLRPAAKHRKSHARFGHRKLQQNLNGWHLPVQQIGRAHV